MCHLLREREGGGGRGDERRRVGLLECLRHFANFLRCKFERALKKACQSHCLILMIFHTLFSNIVTFYPFSLLLTSMPSVDTSILTPTPLPSPPSPSPSPFLTPSPSPSLTFPSPSALSMSEKSERDREGGRGGEKGERG